MGEPVEVGKQAVRERVGRRALGPGEVNISALLAGVEQCGDLGLVSRGECSVDLALEMVRDRAPLPPARPGTPQGRTLSSRAKHPEARQGFLDGVIGELES